MKSLHSVINIIATIALAFSIYLAAREVISPGYCPRLFFIPACYPVLFCYFSIVISSLFYKTGAYRIIFYSAAVSGLAIAVWFSVLEITGKGQCPAILGIPLCFASLIVCVTLIILQIVAYKK